MSTMTLQELQDQITNNSIIVSIKDFGRFGVLYVCKRNGYNFSQWETIEALAADLKSMGWVK